MTPTAIRLEARSGERGTVLRPVRVVGRRELIRFYKGRALPLIAILTPIVFFLARSFLPDRPILSVLVAGTLAAVVIARDREPGFMRQVMVAPVHRGAIFVGLSVAVVIALWAQGAVMVALGAHFGVSYSAAMIFILILALTLIALLSSAITFAIARRSVD